MEFQSLKAVLLTKVTPPLRKVAGVMETADFIRYSGLYVGVLDLATARMMEGDLPQKALALAQEWTRKYSKELLEIWDTQEFRPIEPLQ